MAVLITAAILNWPLMLAMLVCIPVIGASVGTLTQLLSGSTQEGSSHYSKAGGVATEVGGVCGMHFIVFFPRTGYGHDFVVGLLTASCTILFSKANGAETYHMA